MRDTHPSPTTDRLPACLCHPCRDERIRALGLLFSDPLFLTELDRRERVLGRTYRWLGSRAQIGELRSIAFIRLSARLRKAPLWREVPGDPDAWARYLNTLTRNVFRNEARAERRRRRRESAHAASKVHGNPKGECATPDADDPSVRAATRDDLAKLEHWSSASDDSGADDGDRRTIRELQRAYAAGHSSHRQAASFIGTSHTEVSRLLRRVRASMKSRAGGTDSRNIGSAVSGPKRGQGRD